MLVIINKGYTLGNTYCLTAPYNNSSTNFPHFFTQEIHLEVHEKGIFKVFFLLAVNFGAKTGDFASILIGEPFRKSCLYHFTIIFT